MTLLLTECSNAGIVMAADSTITMLDINGRILERDKQDWLKVIRIPGIKATVGYWGFIGKVYPSRFDIWLQKMVSRISSGDLVTFAQQLTEMLNEAAGGRPLHENECVGFHLAGYHPWSDGVRRPYFIHINNGPGYVEINHEYVPSPNGTRLARVVPRFVGGPRSLFQVQVDFPDKGKTLEQNISQLEQGYLTRNGDFFYYTVLWEALNRAFDYLNIIPGVSVPRDPTRLGSRRALLVAALETTIRIYRLSNQSRIIGGEVHASAIGPQGFLS